MTCGEVRTAIRANADSVEQALAAKLAGADGIGLCRTESMLLSPERLPLMHAILVAGTIGARQVAIDRLSSLHQQDIEALFRSNSPLPVTIRLLDPPLGWFLPEQSQLDTDISDARADENWEEYQQLDALRQMFASLRESNPSMGYRGCRLSLTQPALLEMQIKAILRAALEVNREGGSVSPDIIVPLVASEHETQVVARAIHNIASTICQLTDRVSYRVGALIELPRAAICVEGIVQHVDFIAFGTNDLTQMTFGFSREDMQVYFARYLKEGIFLKDPFVSIDQEGVGHLIASAILAARDARPDIEIGICGDHGSDSDSVRYFRSLEVNYISCPPAFVKAAQQAIDEDFCVL